MQNMLISSHSAAAETEAHWQITPMDEHCKTLNFTHLHENCCMTNLLLWKLPIVTGRKKNVEDLSTWSYQFSSVQSLSLVRLCDPVNCSTPCIPVHHQLLKFTQTHVHWDSDAIQPSHPLSSPSPPAPNPSQHQSLFQWVNSLHDVAKVLEFQL